MPKKESGKTTVLSIEASRALREKLRAIARKEKRSMSAQGCIFIEQAVERFEKSHTLTVNHPEKD